MSAIIVEKERRRAQLFNLSPPPHSYAEQASAGRREEWEGRSVTVSHRMTYFSKDPNTNRCKHTSRTQRNLGFRNCSVEDIKKPVQQDVVPLFPLPLHICFAKIKFIVKFSLLWFPSDPVFFLLSLFFCFCFKWLGKKPPCWFLCCLWLLMRMLSLTADHQGRIHTFTYSTHSTLWAFITLPATHLDCVEVPVYYI